MVASEGTTAGRVRLLILGLVLSAIGAGLSIYSTMHHLEVKRSGSSNYGCNINASISCDDVARSPYSEIMNVPLGVWGLSFFLAIAAILLLAHFLKKNEREGLQTFALLSFIGVIASLALGILSVTAIGTYCIVCIGVYAVCMALLVLTLTYWKLIPKPFTAKNLGNGGFSAALVVVLIISGYKFFLPSQPNQQAPNLADLPPDRPAAPIQPIAINKTKYSGLGEDYRKGPDGAKVTVIEFADFECPACGVAARAIHDVYREFEGQVLVVFKNYPLGKDCNRSVDREIHPNACRVATLARCAGEIGKFWEYHDKAFAGQSGMNKDTARRWAKEVGLSDAAIDRCIASKDLKAKIEDDVNQGEGLGISSTPTIFINGYRYTGGLDVDSLRLAISRAIKNP